MQRIHEILETHYMNYSTRRFQRFVQDEEDNYFKLRFLLFFNDLSHPEIKEQKSFQEYLTSTPDELLKIVESSLHDNDIHSSAWMEERVFHQVDNKMLDLPNYREILKKVLSTKAVDEALNSSGERFLLLNRLTEFNNMIFSEEFLNNYDPYKFNDFLESMIPKDYTLKFVERILLDEEGNETPKYAFYHSGDIFKFEGDNFLKFVADNYVDENHRLTFKRNFGDINSRNIVKNDFLVYRAIERGLDNDVIVELSYQLFNARPGLYTLEQIEYFVEDFDETMPVGWQIEMV